MQKLNILKSDINKNMVQAFSSTVVIAMSQRIGMWGEDMFGSFTTLGAGYSVSYSDGQRNTIMPIDKTLNIIQVES